MLLALLAACTGPVETDTADTSVPDTDSGVVDSGETHPYDSPPQAPVLVDGAAAPALASGLDVMLFVNGRLSDASTAYATNRIEQSRIVGPEAFFYDPRQPGRLAIAGRPDYGAVDGYQAKERQKLEVVEVAWSPEDGLWAVHIDPFNDEWLLGRWDLGAFSVDLWGFPVDDDQHHSLYWEYGVEAMEFVDGRLLFGSTVDYGTDAGGEVYALDTLPPTYDPAQPDDDLFYMAERPTAPLFELPHALQFAGDLVPGFAAIDASDPSVLPKETNQIHRFDGETFAPCGELTVTGGDVEGLARIDGTLWAITVDAKIYAIDEATCAVTPHDDLGPLFRDLAAQVRVRGATRVVLP